MRARYPTPPGPLRYTHEQVTAEIDRYIRRQPRGIVTKLARAAGMPTHAFSKRQGNELTWTIEQIGALAEAIKAPTGWPWVPWEVGEALDSVKRLVDQGKP